MQNPGWMTAAMLALALALGAAGCDDRQTQQHKDNTVEKAREDAR
jgi:hypothetical protein